MNIRWPLWIPATRQDAFLFIALAICAGYLLLGNFQNLPIIPAVSKIPTQEDDIYFWLAAITALNYSIVLKNSRNDYIFWRQQLIPCALTTLLVVTCFALIIAYRNGLSLATPYLEKARYLIYSEIHAFVILNVSFLFKETNSPVRDIANEVRWLNKFSKNSRKQTSEPDANQWEILKRVVQALVSASSKSPTMFARKFKIDGTDYDLSTAAKAVLDEASRLGPTISFKRLKDSDSSFSKLVRGVVENAGK